MKRLSAALILALYSSYALGAPVPITAPVTTTTTTIPGNSSLLDDVIEATNARNNLKVVPSSQIGQQLVTQAELSATPALSGFAIGAAGLAGLAYYQRTGKDPVYALFQAAASAADAIFVPGYQAFKANFVSPESYPASAAQYIGKEGSVGSTIGDLSQLAISHPTSYPLLKDKVSANSSGGVLPASTASSMPSGSIATMTNGSNVKLVGPTYYTGIDGSVLPSQYASAIYKFPIAGGGCFSIASSATGEWHCWNGSSWNGTWLTAIWVYNGTATTLAPTLIAPALSINYDTLKNAIKNSLTEPSFSSELKNAIANSPTDKKITSSDPNPSTVPAQQPSPITNNDVSNFFTANTTNIYNEYLNTVNNGGDVNTAQAAAELAKAQEEEAEKETEEKFNPLDANPFQNPYNPGPFDIPTRFTTFLQNVKSSGLFSFSTAFFNSLPGGGSPLLTIDGGQTFGSHTFDFSQSLGSGLAILKSVLLALFGFLSVRAVIMKR